MAVARPEVIMGVPLCRRTAFLLDKFLANQREIQQAYPDCRLVLATDEPDFVAELEEQIKLHHLKGEVITYETVKPDYARSRIWSVTCGREAIRRYALSEGAGYLLYFDADMTYAPSVISILMEKIGGFDVVSSGYMLPRYGAWGFGGGCVLIKRETLAKITFRCYEFKNGWVIYEDESLDMDLFRCRARVKKGIFVPIKHYTDSGQYYAIEPQPVGWFRKLTNSLPVRYVMVRMGLLFKFNIAGLLHIWLYHGQKLPPGGRR
jgi:hypothetical protein